MVNEFPPEVQSSDQVFWISLNVTGSTIYMANVYLAPNSQDKEANSLAVERLIKEINLLSRNPHNHIMAAGDWNADPYKKSGSNLKLLNKILDETNFKLMLMKRPSPKFYTCSAPGRYNLITS